MDSVLRVLHLEDDVTDTELVRATLEVEGLQNQLTRVQTQHDFIAALKRGTFDVVLADYTLPSFDGLSALRIARQECPTCRSSSFPVRWAKTSLPRRSRTARQIMF